MTKSLYQERIKSLAPQYDARHIEAFMRCEHGTLDGLDPARFKAEVSIAAQCVKEGGIAMAEAVAKSYGF